MVYDRRHDDRELTFEASGALRDASLIMRDRETDSWWSMMSGEAIGGALEGTPLVEMPVGEKAVWIDWRSRHPETLVLSVDGREHVARSPYAGYFVSDRTFRGLRVPDARLPPKAPIFAFRVGDEASAIPHSAIDGARIVQAGDDSLLLVRAPGAPLFASTRAWVVSSDAALEGAGELLRRVDEGSDIAGLTPFAGFDTFWYTWVAAHPATALID